MCDVSAASTAAAAAVHAEPEAAQCPDGLYKKNLVLQAQRRPGARGRQPSILDDCGTRRANVCLSVHFGKSLHTCAAPVLHVGGIGLYLNEVLSVSLLAP